MYDKSLIQRQGLTKQQCLDLAYHAHQKMKGRKVKCSDFDEVNFETSFRIYAD